MRLVLIPLCLDVCLDVESTFPWSYEFCLSILGLWEFAGDRVDRRRRSCESTRNDRPLLCMYARGYVRDLGMASKFSYVGLFVENIGKEVASTDLR